MPQKPRSKKNKYQRKKVDVTVIAVEGPTEKNFLRTLKKQLNLNYKILIEERKPFKDYNSEKEKIMNSMNITKDDELYMLRDIEYSKEWFDKLTVPKSGRYFPRDNVFLSNPCIEVYFLSLQDQVTNKYFNVNEICKDVSRKYGVEYKKGLDFNFKNIVDLAIENDSKIENNSLENQYTNFSNIDKLIEKLIEKKEKAISNLVMSLHHKFNNNLKTLVLDLQGS